MNRAERQTEIDNLTGVLGKAQIVLFADYRGLTVTEINGFRKDLRQSKSRGKVVKNTLVQKALEKAYSSAEKAELEKLLKVVNGPSLLIESDKDPVAPTKALAKFAKDNQKVQIKGGWIDGKFLDVKGVETLSKLPGREETLSKLLALIQAPATQLLRLMNAPATQVVNVVEAHRKNLEKGA